MTTTETHTEASERLLDELIETISNVMHWLTAVQTEVVNGTYTPEKAERDWQTLIESENVDFLSVLADYALLRSHDSEQSEAE